MRIVMVTEVFRPTTNGVVVSIETFRAELERQGHHVDIVTPWVPDAPKKERGVYRVASWPLPTNHDYRWSTISSGAFTALIEKLRPDVIHSHHLFILGGLAIKAGRKLKIPVIQTYHTLMTGYVHHVPIIRWLDTTAWLSWLARPVRQLAEQAIIIRSRSFLNRVDNIITPSPSIANLLDNYGVRRPISIIPTGIELADFKKLAKNTELRAHGIDPVRPFVCFIGRLGQEKNVMLLLKAFAWLRNHASRLNNLQLVLIGDGPDRETIRCWSVNHNLADDIVITGFVEKRLVRKILGRAEVFMFPSLTDTQGIVIQEALAAGVPVVAVNKFGPADYNLDGETGYLVPNSAQRLAASTLMILSNRQLRQTLSLAARKHAEQFSIETTTDKLLQLYFQLAPHINPALAPALAFRP